MLKYDKYKEYMENYNLLYASACVNENSNLSLFKYTAKWEYCMDMIVNKRIYMSSANTFNDPYDSLSLFADEDINNSEQISYNEKLKRTYIHINKRNHLNKIQSKIKVACFSENIVNAIMWSHYAACHEGFCLEYTVKELQNGLKPLFPVIYSDNRYMYKPNILSDKVDVNPQLLNVIVHKHSDWNHEKEWRLIGIDEDNKERYVEGIKPKALYVGARNNTFEGMAFKWLIEFCLQMELELYRMSVSDSDYSMEKLEI